MKDLILSGLKQLFTLAEKYLPEGAEFIKEFVDAGLDRIEDKYIKGEVDTPAEIAISLVIKMIRNLLNIDDKKYGIDKE